MTGGGTEFPIAGRSPKKILLFNSQDATLELPDGPSLADGIPSVYASLGLLTLGSALKERLKEIATPVDVLYYDGALLGNGWFIQYLQEHHADIALIAYSTYVFNYPPSVETARLAKALNPRIYNVVGNDHFSALYQEVMANRPEFDFGFYGNDVVEGFVRLVADLVEGHRPFQPASYPGLVYRTPEQEIRRNPENPEEFHRLPLVDYSLMDSLRPHSKAYVEAQHRVHPADRDAGHRTVCVEIARGCVKFAGKRSERDIPLNACDFCAIIPGSRAIVAPAAERAWEIIRNAFEQGYDRLFVTTDELAATHAPLLRDMAQRIPEWYLRLAPEERPILDAYARADAFREHLSERVDVMVNKLNFQSFFVGFEAFTDLSLRAMNKGLNTRANNSGDMAYYNFKACEEISRRGCGVKGGAIITHLGITPELMETNFELMSEMLHKYADTFEELTFGTLVAIPGSHSFECLRVPGIARKKAEELGLEVSEGYLESVYHKYRGQDLIDPNQLAKDYILGCCPRVSLEMVYDYLGRIKRLTTELAIDVEIDPF